MCVCYSFLPYLFDVLCLVIIGKFIGVCAFCVCTACWLAGFITAVKSLG